MLGKSSSVVTFCQPFKLHSFAKFYVRLLFCDGDFWHRKRLHWSASGMDYFSLAI